MGYYENIYSKRLNRFGHTYQERKQGQREKEFEDYLAKSVYRIDFVYPLDQETQTPSTIPGTLEPYKEDDTETLAYLLTRVDDNIPSGTVLMLPDKDDVERPWMVLWLETMRASGYNRYIILRMIYEIDIGENIWGYIKGPKRSPIEDTLRSRVHTAVYGENENLYLLITPRNAAIKTDLYFSIAPGGITQGFRVTDFDVISTPGVEYVSLDPTFIRDETPAPTQTTSPDDEFYWLNGGTPVRPTSTTSSESSGAETPISGDISQGGTSNGGS